MTESASARPTVSAARIAEALGEVRARSGGDGTVRYPTPEQTAVIEADPREPALVVAGAGSGKTETMANRVLWLVANGHVAPAEVLGLTFTRKAAGELAERIRVRLAELHEAGLTPEGHDLFDAPEISTYNAFASAVFRDNALVLGRDGEGVVLGEAAAWQLARSVVIRSVDPRLELLDKRLDAVVDATLRIAAGLADNAADPERVRQLGARFAELRELPLGDRYERADMLTVIDDVAQLELLVDLAAEYDAAKRERGAVDYADQVVLALRAVEKRAEAGEELRARFRVVLLDEYQDTSVVQTELLARLFAGTAVTAVGDPNQSIYGWRGASAANLGEFRERFRAGDGGPARDFTLATSWRNGERILDAANALVAGGATAIPVPTLTARPGASTARVDRVFAETVGEEATQVARWLRDRLAEHRARAGRPGTAALLLRARKTQPRFLAALADAGVPYHVLGVGGLLAEPEIADLVSALRVIESPDAGLELVRLLAGARWRVGVADLDALREVSGWLARHDAAESGILSDEVQQRMRDSVADGEGGSIVDALEFVGRVPETHRALEAFSPEGLARLRDASRFFEQLRARAGLELPELVVLVAHELRLDLELAANETRTAGEANLDALLDALSGYLSIAETANLGGFLGWLKEAEQREDLTPRPEDPEPGTVQVLTVHGAKGLEWDAVAVPRLVEEELPARPLEGYGGWLAFGRFPWPERGDAAQLPRFRLEVLDSRKAFKAELDRFKEEVAEHYRAEERRLAYVAVTRARDHLLVSGSFWSGQTRPRTPSRFLRELADAGVVDGLPEAPADDAPPPGAEPETTRWPHEPFGARAAAVHAAAAAVRTAAPALTGTWAREAELLLEERERRRTRDGAVPLPARIPASAFKDYVSDPDAVAEELRRPMPERPYRATRLGTLFHSWVEERYGTAGGGADELDAAPFELDDEGDVVDAERLAELQATFARSEWAALKPVEVEREIHLPFAGRIVICKIDAVYRHGDRFEVVDWKTGKAPRDDADLERKQLQLALYRLAYARREGIDPALIDAAFYFVADDEVIRPPHVDSEQELLERWTAAFG
ncbi:ATP-dependent DNA helicase [Protaetiibacter intestinalis]|uniref:DNA 3'-5' helicase n=1 Tax=Protaetiibacter intestinalis TaxID=2419774 RepID=A0A387B0Q5_9MICO|nr:ATP-dependent DNA helicase [Protaetiibacter intestinalis]AYF97074.1 ATP-dependent helicase [Protaetiibacter intestinalis]